MSEKAARTSALTAWYPEERRGVDPDVLTDLGYTAPSESDAVYREAKALHTLHQGKQAVKAALRAAAVAEIEQQYGLTGGIDASPEAIAQRSATNQQGRAIAEEAWTKSRAERGLPPVS